MMDCRMSGYDENVAEKLLEQEEFDGYMLVNLVGGKSWRIKQKFLGVFGSLNNMLGAELQNRRL